METRAPNIRALLAPIAFALTCVVLAIVLYGTFGGPRPLGAQGYRVDVPLPQASNLVAGSGVQLSGVKIGRVVAVRRAGNAAVATIELQARFAPLHEGTRAIARTKTLLGEGYIEIAPGPPSGPPITDKGRLPASDVQRDVQLDEFTSTFDAGTRQRLRRLFSGLSSALAGRSKDLNDSLGNLGAASTNLSDVIHMADAQSPSLARLISNGTDVIRAVAHRDGTLRAAVTASDQVLATTADTSAALRATIAAFPSFLGQLTRTSRVVTAASPDLNRAVSALLPSAKYLRPALDAIDQGAPKFRQVFTSLPETIAQGRRALAATRPLARATRRGLREFYPTVRELLPFLQLASKNSNIINLLANVGSLVSGTTVGPGGLVTGYASGVPSVWNETISGWTHKLPTNRQNPYPRSTDSLLDTGRIGVVKSYDCRNVNNPLLVPSTGLGAPPCILQGPWTFNGKTAYYPRLELAGR